MTYTERKFEDHIEYELVESGYKKRKTESYNKDLCSIPDEEMEGLMKETLQG